MKPREAMVIFALAVGFSGATLVAGLLPRNPSEPEGSLFPDTYSVGLEEHQERVKQALENCLNRNR